MKEQKELLPYSPFSELDLENELFLLNFLGKQTPSTIWFQRQGSKQESSHIDFRHSALSDKALGFHKMHDHMDIPLCGLQS